MSPEHFNERSTRNTRTRIDIAAVTKVACMLATQPLLCHAMLLEISVKPGSLQQVYVDRLAADFNFSSSLINAKRRNRLLFFPEDKRLSRIWLSCTSPGKVDDHKSTFATDPDELDYSVRAC